MSDAITEQTVAAIADDLRPCPCGRYLKLSQVAKRNRVHRVTLSRLLHGKHIYSQLLLELLEQKDEVESSNGS